MKNIKIYLKPFMALLMVTILVASCRPEMEELELGPAPEASFTATPLADNPNKIVFQKTSASDFMYSWDFGNGVITKVDKSVSTDTIHYPAKGDYEVALTVFGKGGSTTVKQVISIANDDLCSNESLIALTGGCTAVAGKTWVLAPKAGALVVAPPTGAAWWSSGAGDVAGRPCMFNDEYTFKTDGTVNTLTRNMNGDFWVDEEGGAKFPSDMPAIGCFANGDIPAKYDGWKDANLTFELSSESLKVMGPGAYMGLYKAGDAGTTDVPEEANTYTILSLTEDELVIKKTYDWGSWTFTFAPKGAAPEEPGPVTGTNILKGSNMDAADAASWTSVDFAANAATAEYGSSGALKLSSGTPDVNTFIYQAVDVEAGKSYKVSADIKGDGLVNTWIEFYFLDAAPAADPGANGKFLGWSTWCAGNGTINGNINAVECDGGGSGSGDAGAIISFTESKTVYFGFKAGMLGDGSWGADGITFDNVKLIEVE